jgi:hypothetical protein
LEALRRAGIVERLDADHWEIPKDFLGQAAAHDKSQGRKLLVEVHSAVDLDRQVTADAATWLDRQLVGRHRVATAPMGFGHKVQKALERREETLIARNLAYRAQDGGVRYQPDLPARDGDTVRGTYRGSVALTGGRFAVIADERQFTLVPWRQILERFRGREVTGLVRGMGVSWQLGLQRTRGLSR